MEADNNISRVIFCLFRVESDMDFYSICMKTRKGPCMLFSCVASIKLEGSLLL